MEIIYSHFIQNLPLTVAKYSLSPTEMHAESSQIRTSWNHLKMASLFNRTSQKNVFEIRKSIAAPQYVMKTLSFQPNSCFNFMPIWKIKLWEPSEDKSKNTNSFGIIYELLVSCCLVLLFSSICNQQNARKPVSKMT